MADYSQYPDSGENFNQYSDLGRILHRSDEAEGMALMNLLHALDTFRPGVVLAPARVSTDYTALRDRMAGGDSGWKSVGDLARSIVGNHGGGK